MTALITAIVILMATGAVAQTDLPPPAESGVTTNSTLLALPDSPVEPQSWRNPKRWSYQAGIGFITKSSVDNILSAGGKLAEGPAAGEIYLFQVSYKATQFNPELWGHRVPIDLELPAVLGIVNEHGSEAFPQYSAGMTLRLKKFPWNRWLYTNLETGVGLTYSAQVLRTEREKHRDEDRSHLEFYWPVQLMLAHPKYRQHQLVLFNHHHSGGWIFHTGGANTLGVGYRYVFDEK